MHEQINNNDAGWQNRIVKNGEMSADQFLAHPMNARRHPGVQRDALRGSLNSVGWIAPVIISARSGFMLDGHARVEEALSQNDAQLIPFVEVDVTEDEERLILAVFDPITNLASYDSTILTDLIASLTINDAGLESLLDTLAKTHDAISLDLTPPDDFPSYDDNLSTEYHCPKCNYEWSGKAK